MKITITKLNAKLAVDTYKIYTDPNIIFHPYNPLDDVNIINVDGEDFAAILYKNCYMFKCPNSLSRVRLSLTKSLSILLTDC